MQRLLTARHGGRMVSVTCFPLHRQNMTVVGHFFAVVIVVLVGGGVQTSVALDVRVNRPRVHQMTLHGADDLRNICRVGSLDEAAALVNKYDNFVFDCDGVLWGGSHTIDGSIETVKTLRKLGKRTFFVTNNSGKSRAAYCSKLSGFGVQGVKVEEVITSGSAVAGFLKHNHPEVKTVYMIGEDGLEEELKIVGLGCIREAQRPPGGMTEDQFRAEGIDAQVNCGMEIFWWMGAWGESL
ncbi:unnamed protein product [Choristocarpus tenellus]